MEFAQIGLVIIAISWIIQLIYSIKGKKEIQPAFISGYILGVLILVINGYISDSPTPYFDLLTLIIAAIILAFSLKKSKKKTK